MTKKKIALFVGIGVLGIGSITFGSYKVYQNFSLQGFSDAYSTTEIEEVLFAQQQKYIASFEKVLWEQTQEGKKNLSRTGNMSLNLWAASPLWSGTLDIDIWKYWSAYQNDVWSIGFNDMKVALDFSVMWQKNTASGSIWNLDIQMLASGAYLQIGSIFLSENEFLKKIPREYINVFNKISASGWYLSFPYQSIENTRYNEVLKTQNIESLSGAIEYFKIHPFLSVSKQEGTKYYLTPSTSFCGIVEYLKKTEEASHSGNLIPQDVWFPQKNNPFDIAQIDFSKVTECDETTYDNFSNNFSKIFSVYLEKNATRWHFVIEAYKDQEKIGFFEIYSWINQSKKMTLSLLPNDAAWSISWSGIFLEFENNMLGWYIDLKKKSSSAYKAHQESISLSFHPEIDSKETSFSWAYSKHTTAPENTTASWTSFWIFQGEKNEVNSFKGIIKDKSFLMDIEHSSTNLGNKNPNANGGTSGNFHIEATIVQSENQNEVNINIIWKNKSGGEVINGGEEISSALDIQLLHKKIEEKDNTQLNIYFSSNKSISGSLQIETTESEILDPEIYIKKPKTIIELSDFIKKWKIEWVMLERKRLQDIKEEMNK